MPKKVFKDCLKVTDKNGNSFISNAMKRNVCNFVLNFVKNILSYEELDQFMENYFTSHEIGQFFKDYKFGQNQNILHEINHLAHENSVGFLLSWISRVCSRSDLRILLSERDYRIQIPLYLVNESSFNVTDSTLFPYFFPFTSKIFLVKKSLNF